MLYAIKAAAIRLVLLPTQWASSYIYTCLYLSILDGMGLANEYKKALHPMDAMPF